MNAQLIVCMLSLRQVDNIGNGLARVISSRIIYIEHTAVIRLSSKRQISKYIRGIMSA